MSGLVQRFEALGHGLGLQLLALGLCFLHGSLHLRHLQLELRLSLRLGLLLGLLLLGRELAVQRRLAVDGANPLQNDRLLGQVRVHLEQHIEDVDDHLRRGAGQLGEHLHQRIESGFGQRLLPRLLAYLETRLPGRDVVDVLAAGLVPLVQAGVLHAGLVVLCADRHRAGQELLGQTQDHLALQLAGEQQVVEQLGGEHRTLILLCQHGAAGLRIGIEASVLAGHAGHLAQRLDVVGCQVDLLTGLGLVLAAADLVAGQRALGVDGHAVRVVQFFAQLVQVHHLLVPGADLQLHLVAACLEQGARHAVVQRLLRSDKLPDGAIRQAGALVAVRPDRDERETVVTEGRHGFDQRVLLCHDRTHHLVGDRVGNAVLVGLGVVDRNSAPALKQHHARTAVEQVNRAVHQVVEVVVGPHAEVVQAGDEAGTDHPVVKDLGVVAFLQAGADLLLLVREAGQRHVQIHHLDAEDEPGVAQVLLGRAAVVDDVAPRFGADVDGRSVLVAAQPDLHPAKAAFECVVCRLGALKAGPVGRVQPLHELGLVDGVLAGLGSWLFCHHDEVHARAALGAQQPVNGGLDLVVDHRALAAGAKFLGVLVLPLLAVVEGFRPRHHRAVCSLARSLAHEPCFSLLVPLTNGLCVHFQTTARRQLGGLLFWRDRLGLGSHHTSPSWITLPVSLI